MNARRKALAVTWMGLVCIVLIAATWLPGCGQISAMQFLKTRVPFAATLGGEALTIEAGRRAIITLSDGSELSLTAPVEVTVQRIEGTKYAGTKAEAVLIEGTLAEGDTALISFSSQTAFEERDSVVYWDEEGEEWAAVESALSEDKKTVSATVSHLSVWSVKNMPIVTSILVTGEGGATMIATDGGTLQMHAAVQPADATDPSVTWSIEDGTGSGTMSATGLLTAVSDGTVRVKATANDGSGVEGSLEVTIDSASPTGAITINQGDEYTNALGVTLALSADDGDGAGVSQMWISSDSGFATGDWETFEDSRAWTLSAGDGERRIYVKFRDNADYVSPVYDDSIILDTEPPSAPTVAGLTPTPDTTPLWDWNDVAGAAAYRYGYSEGTWITETATALEFAPSTPLSETTHTLYVQAQDAAGNWSGSGSSAIHVLAAGHEVTMNDGDVPFDMRAVPDASFFTGTDDGGTATVSDGFWIAETEVTYELWYAVRDWAENGTGGASGEGQYTFASDGREGYDGSDGASPTSAKYEPVTCINWRDAMIWCNALTEYYDDQNGAGLECVYHTNAAYTIPIRTVDDSATISYPDPGGQDDPYVKSDADGFRLPTSDEWELAARYIDDSNSDGDIKDTNEYYPGDFASGADADYDDPATADYDGDGDEDESGDVAWYGGSDTHDVGGKDDNALGLYDVSGNAYEWCFDWYTVGTARVQRGGSWHSTADYLRVGYAPGYFSYGAYYTLGFRPARTP